MVQQQIHLAVNGESHTVTGDPSSTHLSVLIGGEAAQGSVTSAGVPAIACATGKRVCSLPVRSA